MNAVWGSQTPIEMQQQPTKPSRLPYDSYFVHSFSSLSTRAQLLNSDQMNGKITTQAFQNTPTLPINATGNVRSGVSDSMIHIDNSATAKKW